MRVTVQGDAAAAVTSAAEKRSRILKILREYVEEPDAAEAAEDKRQALYGAFDLMKSVGSVIQPDKEGQLWEELREAVKEFRSPDRVHLRKLLTEYKDILLARADLMKRNQELRTQNTQLRQYLKHYLDQ